MPIHDELWPFCRHSYCAIAAEALTDRCCYDTCITTMQAHTGVC